MVPFDPDTRIEIKERSNGVSELSGEQAGKEGSLVCAHLDHKRGERYDSPENGMRVTRFEECAYHQIHLTRPEKIGMEELQNKSVVTSYMKQFFNREFSLEEVREKIGEAIGLWEDYLEEKEVPEVIVERERYVFKDDSYTPPEYKGRKVYIPGGY